LAPHGRAVTTPKRSFPALPTIGQNTLIAWGSEAEQEKALWIEAHSPHARALPKINLNSLKAVIAQSELLIGNDTGPNTWHWGLNVPFHLTIFWVPNGLT